MMLQLKQIHAGYEELEILKGIDIEIRDKEIVALIGPNGAGKSTVIKSIFNIANVTQGRIVFKGEDITKLPTHQLIDKGIVYIPQGRIVFGNLSVRENLEIGAELIDKKEIAKRIGDVYKIFPLLKDRASDLAFGLSGGQRQMLAIARALICSPKLLLMDEPSLGLSPKLQGELFILIRNLRDEKKISILIVEQNAKKAIEIADRTYLLEDGKVVLHGKKNIIKHKKIKEVYLGGRY